MHDVVTAEFSAIEAVDTEGGTHRLGDLWRERPVALVFLRHYG
jgi:hypothetical protein